MTVANTCLKQVVHWVYDSFGLSLSLVQKEKLRKTLDDYLLKKQIKPEELSTYLAKGETLEVIQDIIQLVTIPESYFFRDLSLFELLENKILPELIQQKRQSGTLKLKIWSAGCSRGEEIYSIAILLKKLLPDIKYWDITLLGTDISQDVLAKARKGEYSALSMRAVDEKIQEKYFEHNKFYHIDASIKQMVSFKYGNIVDVPVVAQVDIIFCRNVFIYFDKATVNCALRQFKRALLPHGMVFLGSSDFVSYYQQTFYLNMVDGVTYLTNQPKVTRLDSELEALKSKQKTTYASLQAQASRKLREIKKLLRHKSYREALHGINDIKKSILTADSPVLYQYKGEALLGLGDISTAEAVLKEGIKQDNKNHKLYYLLGLAVISESLSAAENAFTRAVDLNYTFPEAHYRLAMLYLSTKEHALGIKHLKAAEYAVQGKDTSAPALGSDSTLGELLVAVKNELAYYDGKGDR